MRPVREPGTRVLIAPDSYKGSISARHAAEAIAEGWRSVREADLLSLLPQADGGEGTLDAIAAAIPAAVYRSAGRVTGPDGKLVDGSWLELPGSHGVVELARVSGLPLMKHPDPRGASTRGLGELIAAALDSGITSLSIALGGSASTDGGAGALSALGLHLLDMRGRILPDGGGSLAAVARVDDRLLRARPAGGVRLLSDVTAPLLGPTGAAAVFGPQKGATPRDVVELEAGLLSFARVLGGEPAAAGAGAAGGTAYGFMTAWGAQLVLGSAAIGELTGFAAEAGRADVLITGEGRFDATSFTGKVVGHALQLVSATAGAMPIVIAGQLATSPGAGVLALSLEALAGSTASALASPRHWLQLAGRAAAVAWSKAADPRVGIDSSRRQK